MNYSLLLPTFTPKIEYNFPIDMSMVFVYLKEDIWWGYRLPPLFTQFFTIYMFHGDFYSYHRLIVATWTLSSSVNLL
jgi:hypothetical protein